MFHWLSSSLFKRNISDNVSDDRIVIDKYGQNELHKAAYMGINELTSLLNTKKFDINQGDHQGRTALHIAAAVDNLEGVELLLKENADIDANTSENQQTPTHLAAKHNATMTLLYLCQHGANIQARDHKFRTPLFLAVEYGHEASARVLLDYGADIKSLDNSGQSVISLMFMNMPTVAEEGLNQLYVHDPDTQQSQYQFRSLEPIYNNTLRAQYSRRPIQFIVYRNLLNLANHPIIQKFVDIKWKFYGQMEAWTLFIANTIFHVSWSFFLCLLSNDRQQSNKFRMDMWLFLFGFFCICELLYLISLEISEYFEMRRIFRQWQQQQQASLKNDLKYCSPAQPQERAFLKNKLNELNKMKSFNYLTYWRLYNWIMYAILLLIICILTVDIVLRRKEFKYQIKRIIAIILIPLWLRNLKYLQAFGYIGPFVLVLHKIAILILKYLFVFSEMAIAFTFAFWIIFMGKSDHFKSFDSLIFTIFQVTIVHQYGYHNLHDIDPIMTYILVCLLIFGSIICNNLLVAMLTKTFARAHDHLSAYMVMERLKILVQRDKSLLFYFDRLESHYYVCKLCMPLIIYNNDVTTASFLKRSFMIITKKLQEMEVFLKTRMIDFKGIGGILKRKQEERNVTVLEHEVTILQKKLIRIAGLRAKKNKLLFLQLEILVSLLERMKASSVIKAGR